MISPCFLLRAHFQGQQDRQDWINRDFIVIYRMKQQKKADNQTEAQGRQQTGDSSIKDVSFYELFRFATKRDAAFMTIGALCSLIIGGGLPILSYLWGNITDSFANQDQMVDKSLTIFIEYIVVGVVATFAGWSMQYFWMAAGESQANKCRRAYLEALMRQEVGWFQTQKSSQIMTNFVSDCLDFQLAIGDKISVMLYLISMSISGLAIAMATGWELTLVVLAFIPLLVFSFWIVMYNGKRRSENQDKIFQSANGMAEETFRSIEVVKQLNGQEHEIRRFEEKVNEVRKQSFSFNVKMALGEALCLFSLLFTITLAYWYGFECVQGTDSCPPKGSKHYTSGSVLTILFCLIFPAVNFNQFLPTLTTIAHGKIAARRLFAVIDRQPLVQSGKLRINPKEFKGVFRFEDVTFAYPKDKARTVLRDLTLSLDSRQTGVMGESGCGKSTLLQLMMRFYDPDAGRITLDGVDLRDLDFRWLRGQIGYIGQEPLLFSTSIRENLLIGNSAASEEQMIDALRQAQLLEFVTELGEKLESYVGVGGSQLSGGQKQRIAIARAFLKDPQIMFLDQATSALDRTNEKYIQQALNRVSSQKITVTVAHRLRTIMQCDQIIILGKGAVLQQGTLQHLQKIQTIKLKIQGDIMQKDIELEISPSSRKKVSKMEKRISLQMLKSFATMQSQKQLCPEGNLSTTVLTDTKPEIFVNQRFLEYIKDRRLMIGIGIISALLTGTALPAQSVLVARILSFELMYGSNPAYFNSEIRWELLYMLIISIGGAIMVGVQYYIFLTLGCDVVNKMRMDVYRKIIRLPLSWIQDKDNNAEQITLTLGVNMFTINNVVTKYVSKIAMCISNVLSGLIIAFVFQWRMALVSLVFIPLIGAVGIVNGKMISGYMQQSRSLYEQSAKILADSITHLKTILSYCYEQESIRKYQKRLDEIQNQQFKQKVVSGFVYGLTYFILYFVYGILFFISAVITKNYSHSITDSLSAIFVIIFAGCIAGNNAYQIPDFNMLRINAKKIFEIIDLQDEDQRQRRRGSKLIKKDINGKISFKNVEFRYGSREKPSLKGLNMEISAGEKVAIVGASGCGKSTILKLLLGFYEHQSGEILIDDIPIEDYDIHCLRENFGTVSQQPQLFDESIEYNIVYERVGISKEHIKSAALKANLIKPEADDAQSSDLFQRRVGPRGSHLSGGQKQRLVIARTVLRNPIVLLLDEATSALDKQNEMLVQKSLSAAMKGKTVLSVTHKLEHLSGAVKIFMVDEGETIEVGNYSELMERKDGFYRLLHGMAV